MLEAIIIIILLFVFWPIFVALAVPAFGIIAIAALVAAIAFDSGAMFVVSLVSGGLAYVAYHIISEA